MGEILRELSTAEKLRNSELRLQGEDGRTPPDRWHHVQVQILRRPPCPPPPGVAFCQVLLWPRGEPHDVASQVEAPAQAEAESRDPAPRLPSWEVTHGLSTFL